MPSIKTLLKVVVFLATLSTLIFCFEVSYQDDAFYGYIGLIVTENLVLITLLKDGELLKTKWWKPVKVALIGVVVGVVFKILHLPGASMTLSVFGVTVCVLYSIWFIMRDNKSLNSILKLCWILISLAGFIGIHVPLFIDILNVLILTFLIVQSCLKHEVFKTVNSKPDQNN